jgi:Cu/Ag efflux pump CusA
MALKLEEGSESYAPLARVIIGGLLSSIVLTIFVVPAAYLLFYQKDAEAAAAFAGQEVKS